MRFAAYLRLLAPINPKSLPISLESFRKQNALEALDKYLGSISKLENEWRNCGQDPKCWWTSSFTQNTVRKLKEALSHTKIVLISEWAIGAATEPPFWPKYIGITPYTRRRPRDWAPLARRSEFRILRAGTRIQGQRSLRHVARIAALLLFSEVVSGAQKVAYCKRCQAPYRQERGKMYCTEYCAHADSRRRSGTRSTRKANLRRIEIATQAILQWLKNPRTKWRRPALRATVWRPNA